MKTDVKGIMSLRKGILMNVSDDNIRYNKELDKKLEEIKTKDRINILENKLDNIESMLLQLIKASK